ncbi:MAG: hypothetical protein ACLT8E_00645 [Akkermansia sp.]
METTGWAKQLTKAMGHNTQLVGDDLFVTNGNSEPGHFPPCGERRAGEGQPDRPLTGKLDTVELRQQIPAILPPPGETEDATTADIAVATNAGQSNRLEPFRPH